MDFIYNVPSIEQISFKLTQNFIPSVSQLPNPPPSYDSLDFSISRVSIQNILCQNQEPQVTQSTTPEQSCLQKESTLKTTCADSSGLTPFKKTKASFRQRFVSSNKSNDKPQIKRRFSLHLMGLGTPTVQKKDALAPLRCPLPSKQKQPKKKSFSGKQQFNSKKVVEWELMQLQNSMKIRGLMLQNHEGRQRKIFRNVIQNRSNVIHPIQQISLASQVWTSRRSFRIH